MAGSDVKSVHLVADTNAADNVSVAAAATPNTSFTIDGTDASGGVATFDAARIITATTAGAADSGKTVTITGTDLDGNEQTEVITLPGSATTTAGTKYFKTVTAAEMSAQPAGNVSLGHANGAADIIFGERARLKGAFIVNSATAGTLTFVSGGPAGTEKMKLGTVASATGERDVTIPGEGVMFENGAYVLYTGGSSATFTNMTLFHA